VRPEYRPKHHHDHDNHVAERTHDDYAQDDDDAAPAPSSRADHEYDAYADDTEDDENDAFVDVSEQRDDHDAAAGVAGAKAPFLARAIHPRPHTTTRAGRPRPHIHD
jgi:hypothetical protein